MNFARAQYEEDCAGKALLGALCVTASIKRIHFPKQRRSAQVADNTA